MKKSHRDILEVIGAFVVAFLFYQFLILATGTPLPIVSVVSDSMYHKWSYDQWWENSGGFYENIATSKQEFLKFQNFNGLSRGDLLLVVKPAELKVGDIVIYQRSPRDVTIVHRVIEIDGDRVITKGDNNIGADQPITRANLQGKAVFAVPVLGYPRYLLHLVGV